MKFPAVIIRINKMLQPNVNPLAVILERLRIINEKIDTLSRNQLVLLAEIQKPTGKSGVKKKSAIEKPEIKPEETPAIAKSRI